MIAGDALRIPSELDPGAGAYKDWLHLNVFDDVTGAVGLVNASLHGAPGDPRSRAIGTALVHLPDAGWVGNMEVRAIDEAAVSPSGIALEHVAVAFAAGGPDLLASVDLPADGLTVDVRAEAAGPTLDVELPLPLGPRWISWTVAPVVRLAGSITAGGVTFDASRARGYHDHNWGRWHWGDDLGWEWGCFQAAGDGPAFVASRTTDREHRMTGGTFLIASLGRRRRSWAGARTELLPSGVLEARPRRLPGAMAALHQERARPRLPDRVRLHAADGDDRIELDFRPRAVAQLIAADPTGRGFGFVHELVGEFTASFAFAGSAGECRGMGVFEHVD